MDCQYVGVDGDINECLYIDNCEIITKVECEVIEMVENAIELRTNDIILTIDMDERVVHRRYVCDCELLEKLEDYNEKR